MPKGDTGEFPVTITGYDLIAGDKIQFKMGKNLDTPLVTKEYTTFIDNGCSVVLSPNDTENIAPGIYFYVVKLIKANNDKDTFIRKAVFELEES
jgi:hypothetical protein